jgi:arylsulfatase A-like enzyme
MKKNVLFITADQWRAECLSCLGHQVQTPNLDALASEGVLFTEHYAQAVPCAPSRASIHTGMYLQNHRACTNGTPLDARHTNWAIETRRAGLDPVLFGYTDTANDPRQFDPDDPILKSYEGPLPGINPVCMMGTYPEQWAAWLAEKGYEIPDNTYFLYTNKTGIEYENGGDHPAALNVPAEHHDTSFMVDQVTSYLDEFTDTNPDEAFCVHLSLLRPHPPWIAPEPYNAMYPPESLEQYIRADSKTTEAAQHPWLAHELSKRYSSTPGDPRRLARLKASYFGLMSEVDTNLGRLFDYLKAHNLWQNTLIIFTSDHGEQIGDHHLLGKMGYFDQSYHIPLIIRDPEASVTRGGRVSCFTENIDIMPTLLEWLDLPIPLQCDGESLLSIVSTGKTPADWRTEAHWEYDFRSVVNGKDMEGALGLKLNQCNLNVIRNHEFKYVHFANLPPLLFDLTRDPEELVNLADDPGHATVVMKYAQKLLSWRMENDERTLTHLTLEEQGVMKRD